MVTGTEILLSQWRRLHLAQGRKRRPNEERKGKRNADVLLPAGDNSLKWQSVLK